jgi:hypothetical protein
MATDDRRAVLEALAYGSDASIRPAERLRAVELLDELERHEPPWNQTGRVDVEELQRELGFRRFMLVPPFRQRS